jgi:hypothetical protein
VEERIRVGLLIHVEEPIPVGLQIHAVPLILEVITSHEMMPLKIPAVLSGRVRMLVKTRTVLVLTGHRARPIS